MPVRVALAILWVGCAVLDLSSSAANVPPVLITTIDQVIDEGAWLDLSGTNGAMPLSFFADPDPGDTHQKAVDWGDGTSPETPTSFPLPGFTGLGGSHHYADNGVYTTSVTVTDSAGASDDGTFRVMVLNVLPTLGVTPSSTSIAEGQSVSFSAVFSDPGFDNSLNTLDPSNGGELSESFRYYLNWGDGVGTIATQDVADINGGPGILSTGMFGGSHTYANDGAYTVTVRLADDDMGAYANAAQFVTGVAGVDYVEQMFTVAVTAIPEPGTIGLTIGCLACLIAHRRLRREAERR
jgi:hypothetical protein